MKTWNSQRILSLLLCLLLVFSLFGCKSDEGSSSMSASGNGSSNYLTQSDTSDYGDTSTDISSDSSSDTSSLPNASIAITSSGQMIVSPSKPNTSKNPSSSTSTTNPSTPTNKHENLYGVGYVQYIMQDQVTNDEVVELAVALGVQSMRVWNHATFVMSDYKTIDKKAAAPYHDLYKKLKAKGIQIVAMNHFHYLLPDYPALSPDGWPSSNQVPAYDRSPNSDYMRFLKQTETTWRVLSAEFPEVDAWEISNELNSDDFLSPYGYKYKPDVKPFTLEEKADVSTDMMYYASKGIKAGNPKAIRIMPPMAPVDGINGPSTLKYLERIYQNIESGKFGSKNTDDFFQALAWHPYYNKEIGDEWVKQNNDIFAIAQKHGDCHKKAYLTEVGFLDYNTPIVDRQQGEWIQNMYRLAKEKMPYVESIHYYWMFTAGGEVEGETYALFDKDFGAKKKAIAYQEMTGAKGDLNILKKK